MHRLNKHDLINSKLIRQIKTELTNEIVEKVKTELTSQTDEKESNLIFISSQYAFIYNS
jgi:hypothetical protein